MITLFNTTIKDFPFPLFVSAYAKRYQLSTLKISPRKGVTCGEFISKCLTEFTQFKVSNEYSREAVENYFSIKFNFIQVRKGNIKSVEDLQIGDEIIYVHKE